MCGRLDQSHSATEYFAAMQWPQQTPSIASQAAPSYNASPGTYRPLMRIIND